MALHLVRKVMSIRSKYGFDEQQVDRIIEMAWEDRTTFDAIKEQFDIPEKDVIKLMRQEMKRSSWKMWRARVQGRITKHAKSFTDDDYRFKSRMQKTITSNKISKR